MMVKESSRKCSHCGHNGHNSRTCNNNSHGHGGGNQGVCLKLFGVNILEKQEDSMKKSYSMGNLRAASNADHNNNVVTIDHDAGYLSDGLIHNKRHKAAHERKKGAYLLIYIYSQVIFLVSRVSYIAVWLIAWWLAFFKYESYNSLLFLDFVSLLPALNFGDFNLSNLSTVLHYDFVFLRNFQLTLNFYF